MTNPEPKEPRYVCRIIQCDELKNFGCCESFNFNSIIIMNDHEFFISKAENEVNITYIFISDIIYLSHAKHRRFISIIKTIDSTTCKFHSWLFKYLLQYELYFTNDPLNYRVPFWLWIRQEGEVLFKNVSIRQLKTCKRISSPWSNFHSKSSKSNASFSCIDK